MVYTFVFDIVYLNLNPIFKYFECNNDEIPIFGLYKHLILEIEPRDFLTIFLRF